MSTKCDRQTPDHVAIKKKKSTEICEFALALSYQKVDRLYSDLSTAVKIWESRVWGMLGWFVLVRSQFKNLLGVRERI